jgi:Lon protease-like protein
VSDDCGEPSFQPAPDVARLFPLSGVVLFPHGLLPLHIFEPRYRQMTQDALSDDRAITMAVPDECNCVEPDALNPVVCGGRIHQERRLPDGRFMFMLRGECRARIDRELPIGDRLYRRAKVTPLPDICKPQLQVRRKLQRSFLLGLFRKLMPHENEGAMQLYQFLRDQCPSGVFADVLAYAAPLSALAKVQLLAMQSVDERLELLAAALPAALSDLPTEKSAALEFSNN